MEVLDYSPALTVEEIERLGALDDYGLMETLPEKEYDDITKLAAFICKTPISQITLVGDTHTWYKSSHGMDVQVAPKEISICAHTIANPNQALEVGNLSEDDRFAAFPYVGTKENDVSFYAGVPLISPEGHALGALCVVDYEPRKLSDTQKDTLQVLSRQIIQLFELHKANRKQQVLNKELELRNENLRRFAMVAAHDIKAPLGKIRMATDMILTDHASELGGEVLDMLSLVNRSSDHLQHLIQDILDQSKEAHLLAKHKRRIDLGDFLASIAEVSDLAHQAKFSFQQAQGEITANTVALEQIFLNLFSNAIKYNSKEFPEIQVIFEEEEEQYTFQVIDNGDGVASEDASIFNLFKTGDHKGKDGLGVGLSTVQRLVEGLGGDITYSSTLGLGTTFIFSVAR